MTLAPLAAGLLLAFNAAAQDHSQHQMPMPTQAQAPHQMPMQDHAQHQDKPKAKPKTKPKAKAKPRAKPAPEPVDHAAMGHATPAPQPMDHSGMDHGAMDHSGMDHGAAQPAPMDHTGMDHAGMNHAAMGHTMPRTSDAPITPIPVLTDANRAAAQPPPQDHPAHDNGIHHFVQFNRLEAFNAAEGRGLEWEGRAWIGTDRNKLWLRSEGESIEHRIDSADVEVLYGRAVARWWDVVAGVRHDFTHGSSQDFAAIGVMGVAPYKFEVDATAYVGQGGQTAARVEAEYEALLTNRLILQPLLELNAYGQDDPRRHIGSGLSSAEAGLRLRYEVTRQFAPYVGVVREWSFGTTADLRRAADEAVNDTRIVAGIRIWF
ncbi:copper resistance protein B [Lysobacter tyrosinilyticus]